MDNSLNQLNLPAKPEAPKEEDCCGNNCELCVFEVYNRQVAEWEKICKQIKLEGYAKLCILPSVLSQTKYTSFKLIGITLHTHDTNLYMFQVLETESNSSVVSSAVNLNIGIGQHLIMKQRKEGSTGIITRAYTPISDMDAHCSGEFTVLIKLYGNGEMSAYIRKFRLGDIVHWRGPFGDFQYLKDKFRHVVMCCAGTGIAPMLRVINSIVEDEDDETFVRLLFSCKKYCDVLFSQEILKFASYWNFSYSIFITGEPPKDVRYGECVVTGRISKEIIEHELADRPLSHTLVLICGTDSFNNDVKSFVTEVGILERNIHIF